MSRLAPIQLPFTSGLADQSDPKLQDPSHVQDVVNARLPATGSLRLRRGWRPLAMGAMGGDGDGSGGGTSTLVAEDLYSCGDALVIKCHKTTDTHAQRLAYYVASNATRPWRLPSRNSYLPPATFVRTFGNVPQVPAYSRADAAITHDGVYGGMLVTVPATASTTAYAALHIFRLDTGETVWYFICSADSDPRRLVSLGSSFLIVRNASGSISFGTVTPSNASAGIATLGAVVATSVDEFEVATARESTPSAIHLLTRAGSTVTYSQFDPTTGAIVGTGVTVTTSAAADMSIASDDSQVFILTRASVGGHQAKLVTLSATSPYSTVLGPTNIAPAAGSTRGLCSVSYSSSTIFCAVSIGGSVPSTQIEQRSRAAHTLGVAAEYDEQRLVSGWVVREDVAAIGLIPTDPAADGATPTNTFPTGYVAYIDASTSASLGPWWADDYGLCGFESTNQFELHYAGQGPVTTALVVTPAIINQLTQPSVRAFEVSDPGRRQGCELNDVTYVAGGIMTQFSSAALDGVENGILPPFLIDATDEGAATGSVEAGTYGYRAICTWTDALGRIHRSAVGSQATVVVAADTSRVLLRYVAPKTLRRDANGFAPLLIEAYRTEKGLTPTSTGEIFRFVGSNTLQDPAEDNVNIVDSAADASLLGRRVLYTEGDIGAVSGALDITPATPHGYVAPLRNRLAVGFLDLGSGYQLSQTVLPNEPVAFTQPGVSGTPALAYQDTIEGRITAIAALDDTIVVASRDHIYASTGDGPNLAGQGEFTSPARFPSDVGVYDWRSLLENSEGLYFLGSLTDLYLLPRGGGSPARVQNPRSIWARGTVVGAGTSIQDNCSLWALDTGAAGVAAVRDVAKQIWLRDTLPFRPVALRAHQGVLYAVDTAGTVWQQDETAYGDGTSGGTAVPLQIVTGDILPVTGGLAGFGRVGAIEVLGEYAADATVQVEASYDSGATFSDLGTYTVSGLTTGTMWQRQWYPAQQRTGKLRLRITMTPSSSTTEGCRLAGCVVYLVASTGPTRLDSTRRK